MTSEEIIKDLKKSQSNTKYFEMDDLDGDIYSQEYFISWNTERLFQYQHTIVKHKPSETYIRIMEHREDVGIHDYDYSEITYEIVEPYEITITQYRNIKES